MPSGKRGDDGEERTPLLEEKYSFDDLAKGVASGAVSRGRALRLAGAAILGSALSIFTLQEEAHAAPCSKCGTKVGCDQKCKRLRSTPNCRQKFDCRCLDRVEGGSTCGYICCGPDAATSCETSADCGPGRFCSVTAGECCERTVPVCVTPCVEKRPSNCSG